MLFHTTKQDSRLPIRSPPNEKNDLIDFVRGIDVYDDNLNGVTTDKRDWLLGSFLHSRPKIIYYKTQTVIYAGANDGMLHAFDDATGEELWGFIPPILLGRLKELHTDLPPEYLWMAHQFLMSLTTAATMSRKRSSSSD